MYHMSSVSVKMEGSNTILMTTDGSKSVLFSIDSCIRASKSDTQVWWYACQAQQRLMKTKALRLATHYTAPERWSYTRDPGLLGALSGSIYCLMMAILLDPQLALDIAAVTRAWWLRWRRLYRGCKECSPFAAVSTSSQSGAIKQQGAAVDDEGGELCIRTLACLHRAFPYAFVASRIFMMIQLEGKGTRFSASLLSIPWRVLPTDQSNQANLILTATRVHMVLWQKNFFCVCIYFACRLIRLQFIGEVFVQFMMRGFELDANVTAIFFAIVASVIAWKIPFWCTRKALHPQRFQLPSKRLAHLMECAMSEASSTRSAMPWQEKLFCSKLRIGMCLGVPLIGINIAMALSLAIIQAYTGNGPVAVGVIFLLPPTFFFYCIYKRRRDLLRLIAWNAPEDLRQPEEEDTGILNGMWTFVWDERWFFPFAIYSFFCGGVVAMMYGGLAGKIIYMYSALTMPVDSLSLVLMMAGTGVVCYEQIQALSLTATTAFLDSCGISIPPEAVLLRLYKHWVVNYDFVSAWWGRVHGRSTGRVWGLCLHARAAAQAAVAPLQTTLAGLCVALPRLKLRQRPSRLAQPAKAGAGAGRRSEPQSGAEARPGAGAGRRSEPQSGVEARPGAGAGRRSEPQSGTEAKPGAGAGRRSEPQSGTEAKPGVAGTGSVEEAAAKKEEADCILCFQQRRCCVLRPCAHLYTCMDCSTKLLKRQSPCPICRSPIEDIFRVFL